MKLIPILLIALMLTGCAVADADYSAPVQQEIEETTVAAVEAEPEPAVLTDAQIEELKKSCVMIYADNGETQVQGSAVAIGENRYLTAYHVIADGRTNLKTSDGEKLTVESYSEELDIMVVTSENKAIPVKIGDIRDSRAGDEVIIIGSPQGNNDTVTRTTVKRIVGTIILDGVTIGGASGSGVFDMQGNLIGIIKGGNAVTDESYAVTINAIEKAL
jgi:S1-C subfamily serine protease